MARFVSLAYLTAKPLAPPDAISLAARLGYDGVGLRLLPSLAGGDCSPLIENAGLRRETIARMSYTGISVLDVEIIRIGSDFDVTGTRAFLDCAAELRARAVLVAGDDPLPERFAQNFAAFAELCGHYGLTADLEFMPWTMIATARDAVAAVAASGPAGGVLVDALHFARSATTLDDIAAIPRARLHFAQICDAPKAPPASEDGLIHAARRERLLPGAGGLDIAGLLAALPDDLPLSLEIPNDAQKDRHGVPAWAGGAFARLHDLLGAGEDGRHSRSNLRRRQ